MLLRLSEDRYWFSISDGDVLLWCKAVAAERGLKVSVHKPDVSPLAIQGPRAEDVTAALLGEEVRAIRHFRFREISKAISLRALDSLITMTRLRGPRVNQRARYAYSGNHHDQITTHIAKRIAPGHSAGRESVRVWSCACGCGANQSWIAAISRSAIRIRGSHDVGLTAYLPGGLRHTT